MSFVLNDASMQQMSFLDSYNTLTDREKKFLEKSWAKYFAEHIFPKIDERPYAVLYSGKDSRPNTPVNIQIGALIIKEFKGLSDDELLEALIQGKKDQFEQAADQIWGFAEMRFHERQDTGTFP